MAQTFILDNELSKLQSILDKNNIEHEIGQYINTIDIKLNNSHIKQCEIHIYICANLDTNNCIYNNHIYAINIITYNEKYNDIYFGSGYWHIAYPKKLEKRFSNIDDLIYEICGLNTINIKKN